MKGVYIIRTPYSEKVYVGQSGDLKRRFREHRKLFKNNDHHIAELQEIYNKHGKEGVIFEIFLQSNDMTDDDMHVIEKRLIETLDSFKNGFNGTLGGRGHYGLRGELNPNYGRKISDETKEKFSLVRKGKGNSFYGKKHKLETIKFFKESQLGHKSKITSLTEKEGIMIKIEALTTNKTNNEIGKTYNVSSATVSRIKTGKRWGNLPDDINELNSMLISSQDEGKG